MATVVADRWLLTDGYWPMVTGRWLLADGYWPRLLAQLSPFIVKEPLPTGEGSILLAG